MKGEGSQCKLGKGANPYAKSPKLKSLFAFDNTIKDAVNKRYIVVNAGSNPAPDYSGITLIVICSFYKKQTVSYIRNTS
jgi:hypothetical protein